MYKETRMFTFITTLGQVQQALDPSKPVFADTETAGLYGKVRLLQLYQPTLDKPLILDVAKTTIYPEVLEFLKTLHLVFHNATYDLRCLQIIPKKLDDTLYLAKLAYPYLAVEPVLENRGFGLDKVCFALGYKSLYQDIHKKEQQKSNFNFGTELTDTQYLYAATDVIAVSLIYNAMTKHLDNLSYKLDILSLLYAARYCFNGISVDQKLVQQELLDTNEKIVSNVGLLNGLNVNSPKQCKEALGVDSTAADVLLKLVHQGNDLAKLIYEQRRLLKRRTMLESYNHPKVYSVFNVAGAATGRFTATGKGIEAGINSQQIPRDLKKLFYNPNKNMATIEADYSTLELRLAATIFGDNTMAQQLREGKDLHTEMAKILANKSEVTKEDRFRAKAANFGFVYGMSAASFKDYAFNNYGLSLSDGQAVEWRTKYFTMYKQLAYYHKKVWENYKKPEFLQYTALGKCVKPKLGTDAINAPIQGSGAECTKLAIHRLVSKDEKYLDYIVNVVHDSIKLEVPIGLVAKASADLEASMLQAWDDLCKTSLFKFKDIPMKVDVEVKYGQY